MKNYKQGFVIPLTIAIIALLGVGGGWYYISNKKVATISSTYTKTDSNKQNSTINQRVAGKTTSDIFSNEELNNYISNLETPNALYQEFTYKQNIMTQFAIDSMKIYMIYNKSNSEIKTRASMYTSSGSNMGDSVVVGTSKDGKFKVSSSKACALGFCYDPQSMPQQQNQTQSGWFEKNDLNALKYIGNKTIFGLNASCFVKVTEDKDSKRTDEICMHPKYSVMLQTNSTVEMKGVKTTIQMISKDLKINEPIDPKVFSL